MACFCEWLRNSAVGGFAANVGALCVQCLVCMFTPNCMPFQSLFERVLSARVVGNRPSIADCEPVSMHCQELHWSGDAKVGLNSIKMWD